MLPVSDKKFSLVRGLKKERGGRRSRKFSGIVKDSETMLFGKPIKHSSVLCYQQLSPIFL